MVKIVDLIKNILLYFLPQNIEGSPKNNQDSLKNVENLESEILSSSQTEDPLIPRSKQTSQGLSIIESEQKSILSTLQKEIDCQTDNATLKLWPPGYEYPGPIMINCPIILDGQGATIWAVSGPVVSIQSDRVSLYNLRIEVTGDKNSNEEENCAILVKSGQSLQFNDVEVRGTVMGLPGEEGEWKYPNFLDLGQLAPRKEHDFILRIIVPVTCKIASDISGIEFEPRHLTPGNNEILLHIDPLPKDTLINGNIFIVSDNLKRRIILTAHIRSLPDAELSVGENNIIWQAENWLGFIPLEESQSHHSQPDSIIVESPELPPLESSEDLKLSTRYLETQSEVQQSQISPLSPSKIRRGEQPNNQIFISPNPSNQSTDIQENLLEQSPISDIFMEDSKDDLSQSLSVDSPSISVKKYSPNNLFFTHQDHTPTSEVEENQELPQPQTSPLFQDLDSKNQGTPFTEKLSTLDRSASLSQSINPIFKQTPPPSQPSEDPDGESQEESSSNITEIDSSQSPKRKIFRPKDISPLFVDKHEEEKPDK